jgi:hypothetical protein
MVYPETRIDNAIMLSTTRLGTLRKPKANGEGDAVPHCERSHDGHHP